MQIQYAIKQLAYDHWLSVQYPDRPEYTPELLWQRLPADSRRYWHNEAIERGIV